jgi:glycosyltransferase involved in cell wall biosynthesis
MHILHVTDAADSSDDELAPLIQALAARGIGGEITTVGAVRSPIGWWRRNLDVRAALARGRYDVVHAHGATAALAAAMAQRRVPVIAHLRDELHDGRRARTAQWAARLCRHVLVSDALSALRVVGDDVRVMPIGIDSARFSPRPRAHACAALRLDPNKLYVTAERSPVGTEVLRRVQRTLPDAVLLPVDGNAQSLRPDLFNAADALLVATLSSATPRLIKQALACNLPIVAVRGGDVARLLATVFPSMVADDDVEALAASTIAFLRAGTRSDGRSKEPIINVRRTADELCGYYAAVSAPAAARQPSQAVA